MVLVPISPTSPPRIRGGWSCWSLLASLYFPSLLLAPIVLWTDDWGSANHRAEAIWWGWERNDRGLWRLRIERRRA
ncbi:hypothetical protein RB213_003658 [Colletotrichum asianum]